MHDGRVVASAERIADRRQAEGGQLFGQTHGDLTRTGNVARALFTEYIADFNAVIFGSRIDDGVGGNDFVFFGDDVLQRCTRQIHVDNGAVHKAAACTDAVERAFQFAHVGTNQVGNKQCGLVFNADACRFCLFLQNRHAHFQLGRLKFQSQTP